MTISISRENSLQIAEVKNTFPLQKPSVIRGITDILLDLVTKLVNLQQLGESSQHNLLSIYNCRLENQIYK